MTVDWYASAQADIPRASDPEKERAFSVRLGNDPSLVELPKNIPTSRARILGRAWAIIKMAFGTLVGIPGFSLLAIGIRDVALGEPIAVMGIVAGGAFAILGSGVAINGFLKFMAGNATGPVDVSISPDRCQTGGNANLRVSLQPKKPHLVEKITASLVGREKASVGSTGHSKVFEQELHREEKSWTPETKFSPAPKTTMEACWDFPIPARCALFV